MMRSNYIVLARLGVFHEATSTVCGRRAPQNSVNIHVEVALGCVADERGDLEVDVDLYSCHANNESFDTLTFRQDNG